MLKFFHPTVTEAANTYLVVDIGFSTRKKLHGDGLYVTNLTKYNILHKSCTVLTLNYEVLQ
jgi:hypothetical protein